VVSKESGFHAIMVSFKCEWRHSAELGDKGGREADDVNFEITDKEVDAREVTVGERIDNLLFIAVAGTDAIIGGRLRALRGKFNDRLLLVLLQCKIR